MQTPQETTATETLLDSYGTYHLAALKAEPKAKDIATDFGKQQTDLEAACDITKAAEKAEVVAQALADRAEADVEDSIRQVEGRVLLSVNKKRKAEPYVTAFPKGLTGALRHLGKSQAAEAYRIASVLDPYVENLPELSKLLTDMTTQADLLNDRHETLEACEMAVSSALATERTQKRLWRAQYRKDFGLLTSLFPLDKKRVNSFFKATRKNRKKTKTKK